MGEFRSVLGTTKSTQVKVFYCTFFFPKLYLSLPVVFAPDPCPSSRKQKFIQISELPIVPLLSQWCLFLSDEGGTSAMAPVQSPTWWAL